MTGAAKAVACTVFFFSACTGKVRGAGETPPGSSPPKTESPADADGGPRPSSSVRDEDCPSNAPRATILRARLLTPSQYDNTVDDLLHLGGQPAREFGGGANTQLDDLGAERRSNAAAMIAQQAAVSLPRWAPCVPPAIAEASCAPQIIEYIGTRAYRRPLTAVDRSQLSALFQAGMKEKDFATGVEWLLAGVLQSPDFLYQFSRALPGQAAGQVQTISGYEMASRLSYLIWDSMPDDALFAAAAAPARLSDDASLRGQIQRMLQDRPRFLRGVASFYSSWLTLDTFRELARDDKAFTSEVVQALKTSLLMTATQLYSRPSPTLTDLLSGQTYYLNGALRAFYGLPSAGLASGGADFVATEMPQSGRHGILTHPALLAQMARPRKTHPINRGLFVRSRLLCQEMVPPAGLVIPPLPDQPVMGATTREETMNHRKPQCSSCHALIDPPGFALESFDQVGRHRDSENGRPIDTSDTMISSGDLDGPFANGDELLRRLDTSATVRDCFAQQYLQFALSGDVSGDVAAENRCALKRVRTEFAGAGDLERLLIAVATSDAFRFRVSEGAGP